MFWQVSPVGPSFQENYCMGTADRVLFQQATCKLHSPVPYRVCRMKGSLLFIHKRPTPAGGARLCRGAFQEEDSCSDKDLLPVGMTRETSQR